MAGVQNPGCAEEELDALETSTALRLYVLWGLFSTATKNSMRAHLVFFDVSAGPRMSSGLAGTSRPFVHCIGVHGELWHRLTRTWLLRVACTFVDRLTFPSVPATSRACSPLDIRLLYRLHNGQSIGPGAETLGMLGAFVVYDHFRCSQLLSVRV